MQDGSSFFGAGGGLIARPPKRVTPANRGANNAYHFMDRLSFLSRVAAGTHFKPNSAQGAGNPIYLYNSSTGSQIAYITDSSVTGLTSGYFLVGTAIYDWVAGFWYILARDSTKVALCKINDTTGAMTVVGTAVAPTTIANWNGGTAYLSGTTMKYVALASGVPRVHTIDLATGAISSQDQQLVLSDGTVVPYMDTIHYITADNSAVIAFSPLVGSSSNGSPQQVGVSFAKGGVVQSYYRNFAMLSDTSNVSSRMLYNGETLSATDAYNTTASGWRHYDRTDFDRYVKALIKAAAGV